MATQLLKGLGDQAFFSDFIQSPVCIWDVLALQISHFAPFFGLTLIKTSMRFVDYSYMEAIRRLGLA